MRQMPWENLMARILREPRPKDKSERRVEQRKGGVALRRGPAGYRVSGRAGRKREPQSSMMTFIFRTVSALNIDISKSYPDASATTKMIMIFIFN
jgi:hypothetical protein